jgi:hypothetical protein
VNLFTKLALILQSRQVRLPVMPKVPTFPTLRLGNKSASKAVIFSVGLATTVVATGIFFAVKDVANATWEWPEQGAVYRLPQTMGEQLDPYADGTESQTLKINLAAGTRLSSLKLIDIEIGRASTPCVTIERASGTTGWLYVDNWTITGVSATSADFANMEIGSLVMSGVFVDGHTMEATLDATIAEISAESSRSSGEFLAENSVVDQIVIVLLGDATINNLVMTDIDCGALGTGWNIDYVKAGMLTIGSAANPSKWGDGDGIDAADFVVNSTVKARTITDFIVDTPLSIR